MPEKRTEQLGVFFSILGLSITLTTLFLGKEYVLIVMGLTTLFWFVLSPRIWKMLAIDELNRHIDKCKNPGLTIEKVIQKVNVDGVNAKIRREYLGKNTSNEKIDSFITYAMGDKRLSLSRISFKAWDFTNGKKEMSVVSIKDIEPSKLKLLKIEFAEPLKRHENFHVVVEYNWPGAIGPDDYVSIKLSPYRPTAGSEFEVTFDKDTILKFYELRGEKTNTLVEEYAEKKSKNGFWLKYKIPKADEDYKLKFRTI